MLDERTQSTMVMTETTYCDQALPALRLARSSRLARRIARLLIGLMFITIILLLFAPWQQTVSGSGNVIAYAPLDRQQVLGAPAKGRVSRWGEGIYENAYVEAGQVILEIQDLDPNYLTTLVQQRDLAQNQVDSYEQQLAAEKSNLRTAEAILPIQEGMIETYKLARDADLAATDALILAAEQKVVAAKEKVRKAEAERNQLEIDRNRQERLAEKGLTSKLKFQEVEAKYLGAVATLGVANSELEASMKEVDGKKKERESKLQKWGAEIAAADAKLQDVKAKIAQSQSKIAKSQSELSKSMQELAKAQIAVNRQQNQIVTAPRAGYIQDLVAMEGKILKEGDKLCTLVPRGGERAVQIWVDGNDAPLVEPGRHVRLQFEGWPAVQFSGWPSVAVGTFGGTVASVDNTDDNKGRFRVIVLADPEDQPWPDDRYLRQGVRANGWILLDRVTLGYELWRQLNGFPQSVKSGDDDKPKKIPVKVGK